MCPWHPLLLQSPLQIFQVPKYASIVQCWHIADLAGQGSSAYYWSGTHSRYKMNRYSGNNLCQLQITSKHILTPRWFSSLLFWRYKLSADFEGERRPFVFKAEAETESYDITRGQVKLGFRQKRFGKMVFLWLYSKEYLILVEDKWRNKHILEVLENLGTQEIKW